MRILGALLVFVPVVIGAALAYMYSGFYNVAATDPHNPVVRWALDTSTVRSIEQHADGLEVPDLSGGSLIEIGAQHFKETCTMCHGAPGVQAGEIAKGLKPEAPDLSHAAQCWLPAELFWIVKHGIKMTGMPACGPTHGDEELWAMVAFTEALPDMSQERYEGLVGSSPTGSREGHASAH